jgi:hypothetical protein
MKQYTQEELVHRYLLGDLQEEQEIAFEREYFADPEMMERVWEIENELVDLYVRNRLSGDDKIMFERNYLASPVHRERVAFAISLLERIDSRRGSGRVVTGTGPAISWWSAFMASLRGNFLLWAAMAAVVLLSGLSIFLFSERARLHREIDQLKAETVSHQQRTEELENEIAATREQSDKLANEIVREESQTGASPTETPPRETRSVLSFVLSPMSMRSGGEAQRLRLSKATAAILLQMRVGQPGARVYQVDLRTVEGVKVWSRSSVKARPSTNDSSTVSVFIPAGKLAANDYILTLSATNGANETEEINRYFFRVSKE